jgi:hypothetical protein
MVERRGFNSDRELPAEASIDIVQINAQLAVKIEEVERRNKELGERMVRRIPKEPRTIYIDPAVGE